MPQLEVVKFRDVVPILAVSRFVPGVEPLTLEVKGEDFRNVEEVLINEIRVQEFMVIDKKTMWAQLPDSADRVSSIEVISSGFTVTSDASKLSFAIGDKTKSISGILKLLQLFTKWILQSTGSDIFNPGRGGGLQDIVGRINTSRKMQPILATISRAVDQTTTQIKEAQIGLSGLPADERLVTAGVVGLDVFDKQMEARVRISIRSAAGREGLSAITL